LNAAKPDALQSSGFVTENQNEPGFGTEPHDAEGTHITHDGKILPDVGSGIGGDTGTRSGKPPQFFNADDCGAIKVPSGDIEEKIMDCPDAVLFEYGCALRTDTGDKLDGGCEEGIHGV
jgi:hypothetical protein